MPLRRAGKRMTIVGMVCIVTGTLLLISPLLFGRGQSIKYLLAVGFISACFGCILLILGIIDWLFPSSQ